MKALFRIDNQYDQPENCLEVIWEESPSLDDVKEYITQEEDRIKLLLGEVVKDSDNTLYWIEDIVFNNGEWWPVC